ncbi:MAG: 2-oxoisovalerate dehydrogenase [Phycisphaerales bacterium]|nr:2-oxoisovalerate dehydrogenase [Phycisphaerales bacterium]
MDELTLIVEQEADGGFVAHAVGQSIFTQADTREQLDEMVRDAVRCHFDRPEEMPKRIRLHFIHDEVLAL